MQFSVMEPGVEIIHPTPAFPIYESMINYTGSTPVPYDLTEDKDLKFNPEKILSLITDKTRLLVLIIQITQQVLLKNQISMFWLKDLKNTRTLQF